MILSVAETFFGVILFSLVLEMDVLLLCFCVSSPLWWVFHAIRANAIRPDAVVLDCKNVLKYFLGNFLICKNNFLSCKNVFVRNFASLKNYIIPFLNFLKTKNLL